MSYVILLRVYFDIYWAYLHAFFNVLKSHNHSNSINNIWMCYIYGLCFYFSEYFCTSDYLYLDETNVYISIHDISYALRKSLSFKLSVQNYCIIISVQKSVANSQCCWLMDTLMLISRTVEFFFIKLLFFILNHWLI